MGRATLDLQNPPRLSDQEVERLDRMTAEEVERNAIEDPDNPPFSQDELDRVALARLVQSIRKSRGMSQAVFAHTYRIAVSRLRDWEQGRFKPDAMAQAYLDTIRFEPEAVGRAMERSARIPDLHGSKI